MVYLVEMWVNQHHSHTRVWEDTEVDKTMADPPSGKGRRLILLHAGSKDGFLPAECKLLFVGQTNSADYHSEMNCDHFEEWWECSLLPNLPVGAVIVMDNASYHARQTDEARGKPTCRRG